MSCRYRIQAPIRPRLSRRTPVTAPGPQPQTAAHSAPASGRALPASGNSLPPDAAGDPCRASLCSPAAANPTQVRVPAARISLADIEHSHQLNLASAMPPPVQTDTRHCTRRFMPSPSTAPAAAPAAVSATDSPTDLLPGAEAESMLQQPAAGLTAGDLSRLVQNLAQNGGREPFSAAFRSRRQWRERAVQRHAATGSPKAADSSGLGNMVRDWPERFPATAATGLDHRHGPPGSVTAC